MQQEMGYMNGECMCGKAQSMNGAEQMHMNGMPPQNGNVVPESMTAMGADHVDRKTLQQNLAGMIGKYVIIEMLIGTNEMVLRHGFLTKVGNSYFEVYNPESRAYIMGDLYAIKFVSYLRGGERPDTATFEMWSRAYDEYGRQQYLGAGRRNVFLPAYY